MPLIMIEAFARGLLDDIMLEAFNLLETNAQNEKLRMVNFETESGNIRSQSTHARLQMQDHAYVECNGLESAEFIEKMVRGLRDVQIGDSSSVLPSPLSKLERQVKLVACNIGSSLPRDSNEAGETQISEGQGDVHEIIHDAVIETSTDSPGQTTARKEKEHYATNEASRVSISLLHRMIEELETETEETALKEDNDRDSISKEGIAAWEENEEQFIRTIESVEDNDRNNYESSHEGESINHTCKLGYEELKLSTFNSESFPKNVRLEEVVIEEITSSPLPPPKGKLSSDIEYAKDVDEFSMEKRGKKKRGFAGRMRKFIRTVFGHRKN